MGDETGSMDEDDYSASNDALTVEIARTMKVNELRQKLEELGVKSNGSKKTLINRVRYYATPTRGFPKKRKIKDTEICIENDTSPKTKKRRLMNEKKKSHRNLKNEEYDMTEVRIRMPNGRILQRSFAVNTKINELYTWCMI